MWLIKIFTLILSVAATMDERLEGYDVAAKQPDLSYRLGEAELTTLDEIGFLITPSRKESIYEVYSGYTESPYTPVFISADLPFHTLHMMVDYTVRIIEIEELLPKLETLTSGMLEYTEKEYKRAPKELREAAKINYIYFAVAARLLELDVDVKDKDCAKKVETELERIDKHSGIERISFMDDVTEDYSQYVPRGHYTRSDDFRRYFRTMMWYGRLPLKVPDNHSDPKEYLQAAMLMGIHLDDDAELNGLWEDIYEPTAFFFGAAEDLTPGLLIAEAREFFSDDISGNTLTNEDRMHEFAAYLAENNQPKIISGFVPSPETEEPVKIPVTVRFMPQRFVPDSYIFSELVFDKVRAYRGEGKPFTLGQTQLGPRRVFPRGLDLLAVLRWNIAYQILTDEGDTDYENYKEQFEKMMKWYAGLSPRDKESAIYFRWFDFFLTYKDGSAPPRVDDTAWERKKLVTSLGSWAELRHDAILYAKQSYTGYAMAAEPGEEPPPPPPLHLAAVEDAGGLYARMAECARTIAEFLDSDDPEHPIAETYLYFSEVMDKLDILSHKQREGLSPAEHKWLWTVAGKLSYMPSMLGKVVTGEEDERAALAADVHTDPNSGLVLEEATGDPARLYVIVEIEGKPYVARGGTYTYYEFKHPISERLTDEAWHDLLDSSNRPDMPSWTDPITVNR
ncbi:DUF3160 domain-containing protein [candidate division WOR-3 bacterium]|uniref:DUF3160 domain-containing protein n=1 Tax=candidate division WOR-3 bacterium TaxID=2052148 RepID=A0A9D5QEN1_UNCW3|nr:DUF3160 domain-containing protein [candidate division WOR-3 bacterium]MBD3365190.1 DUF3160 domain-containing protein [candidate division WOR-3 bacterium]